MLLRRAVAEAGGTGLLAVAAYIGGAYFFTSSTSFANPAVTAARSLSDTFAGINPGSVPAFVGCQLAGAGLAVALTRFLHPSLAPLRGPLGPRAGVAPDVIVPHEEERSA